MAKVVFVGAGYESLGMEYISSALKKANHQVSLLFDPILFDEAGFVNIPFLARIFSYNSMIKARLKIMQPDLVCLSVTSDNLVWALNMAKLAKKATSAYIIFGGIHPTSAPEEVIKQDEVDFLCVGEGEDALVELAGSIDQNNIDYTINNIWFKTKGAIIRNPVRFLKDNLDNMPIPDKELYYAKNEFIMKEGYTIITSRGCPHSCSYCCNSVLKTLYRNKGQYLRRRSVDNVIEELEQAKIRYRLKYIHFLDEVFVYDKQWLSEFIQKYIEHIALPFACYLSPQFVDEQVVRLLKQGGCYKVQMGVQTLDEEKRKKILNRHYTNYKVSLIIKLFRQESIYITCDNILGLPGQDEKELTDIARFYCKNKPDFIETFWLRYYPGTDITRMAQRLGEIESKGRVKGITRGGDTYRKELARFQLLLYLIKFMPMSWCDALLRRKMYRYFPASSPIFLVIFFRLFNRARFDLYTSRTLRRYLLYCFRKLFFIYPF